MVENVGHPGERHGSLVGGSQYLFHLDEDWRVQYFHGYEEIYWRSQERGLISLEIRVR